jgi:orotate phosphoribosyltransferase
VIVQRGSADFGVPTRALLDMPLESYDPADCPQCKEGQSIDDPGSRRR